MHFGEFDASVGNTVLVVIREDEKRIVHGLERFPFGVAVPGGGPEATLGVDLELNRVGELGEALLVREEVELEALGHLDGGHGFGGAFVVAGALLVITVVTAADVGFDEDGGGHVGVIDTVVTTLGGGPDVLVPVGGQLIEHDELVLQDGGIGLAVHVFELGAASPDVIATGGAVAVVPVPVFVHDSIFQLQKGRGVFADGDVALEQSLGDDLAELAIALSSEVNAIEGESLCFVRVFKEGIGGLKEIDEANANLSGDFCGSHSVELEVCVVLFTVREVGVTEVFVGDGTEEHDAGNVFATGPGFAQGLHHAFELVFVMAEFFGFAKGFVVAEETENDVGFDVFQVGIHGGEAGAPGIRIGTVTTYAHVAEAEVEAGGFTLEQGFNPAVVLHTVCQAVTDEGNGVALLEGEGDGVAVGGEAALVFGRVRTRLHGSIGFAIVTTVSNVAVL